MSRSQRHFSTRTGSARAWEGIGAQDRGDSGTTRWPEGRSDRLLSLDVGGSRGRGKESENQPRKNGDRFVNLSPLIGPTTIGNVAVFLAPDGKIWSEHVHSTPFLSLPSSSLSSLLPIPRLSHFLSFSQPLPNALPRFFWRFRIVSRSTRSTHLWDFLQSFYPAAPRIIQPSALLHSHQLKKRPPPTPADVPSLVHTLSSRYWGNL